MAYTHAKQKEGMREIEARRIGILKASELRNFWNGARSYLRFFWRRFVRSLFEQLPRIKSLARFFQNQCTNLIILKNVKTPVATKWCVLLVDIRAACTPWGKIWTWCSAHRVVLGERTMVAPFIASTGGNAQLSHTSFSFWYE